MTELHNDYGWCLCIDDLGDIRVFNAENHLVCSMQPAKDTYPPGEHERFAHDLLSSIEIAMDAMKGMRDE